LGVRDEAKLIGDVGSCGLNQCCRGHLKKLGNVTSEFAEDQQIVHRGSERLSGICGRLKCCLAYEEAQYAELIKKLPAVGTRVKTEHGRGEVVGWHVLKRSVDVRLDPKNGAKEDDRPVIVEVPIKN
jgi:cell fate regulator YaaT (PSP1 superfamily)